MKYIDVSPGIEAYVTMQGGSNYGEGGGVQNGRGVM